MRKTPSLLVNVGCALSYWLSQLLNADDRGVAYIHPSKPAFFLSNVRAVFLRWEPSVLGAWTALICLRTRTCDLFDPKSQYEFRVRRNMTQLTKYLLANRRLHLGLSLCIEAIDRPRH